MNETGQLRRDKNHSVPFSDLMRAGGKSSEINSFPYPGLKYPSFLQSPPRNAFELFACVRKHAPQSFSSLEILVLLSASGLCSQHATQYLEVDVVELITKSTSPSYTVPARPMGAVGFSLGSASSPVLLPPVISTELRPKVPQVKVVNLGTPSFSYLVQFCYLLRYIHANL
jgi:hypothetical protein